MRAIEHDFPVEMKLTAGHKIRARNDIQYEMMYYYYVIESPNNYKYELRDEQVDVDYYALRNHYLKNRYHLKRIRQNRKKFVCLNDVITWHGSILAQQTYKLMNSFYMEFFPNATDFEL